MLKQSLFAALVTATAVAISPSSSAQLYIAVEPPPGPIVRRDIQNPIWLEQPERGALAAAYPEAARATGARGEVSLDCIVDGGGRLACRATSESPSDLGFAAASIQVARRYRMAAEDRDGQGTAGAWVTLTFIFNPPR